MGDRHPHDDPVALDLLRPVLERAFVTVRSGQRASPPIDPPPSLRPFLRFTRLRGRALAAVRAAVDGDDELRARVAEAVDDGELGPAAELWLERPDGWDAALADLIDDERASRDRVRTDEAELELRRRIEALERERDRLVDERDAAAEEVRVARIEVAEERLRRREADERADEVTTRIEALGGRTTSAEERARSAEASLGAERARVRELKARLGALESSAAADPRPPATAPAPAPPAPPPPTDAPPPLPLPEIAAVLGDAAAGAERLASSLASLVEVFAPPVGPSTNGSAPRARRPKVRRRPLVLPGLLEDDDEAAAWLLRAPGALVLVDGYNVTISAWPGMTLAQQRDRLVDLLAAEVARTDADVRIVFDGDHVDRSETGRVRCPVTIEFTDADVEADDRILELVATEAVQRPIVVVSSDHRVRDGARAGGANVVASDQLLRHLMTSQG